MHHMALFVLLALLHCAILASANLHEACRTRNLELASKLLQNRTLDVNSFDETGFTPLALLLLEPGEEAKSRDSIVDMLIKHPRINPNKATVDLPSLLHLAIIKQDTSMIEFLLETRSVDVNYKLPGNKQYCTPLLAAIKSADTDDLEAKGRALEIIRALLDHREVDRFMGCGEKLPHLEIIKHADAQTISKFLEKSGCSINLKDNEGNGILHVALQTLHANNDAFKIVSKNFHVDHKMTDRNGNTALHLIFMNLNNPSVFKLIEEKENVEMHKASAKIVNRDGDTPIHIILRNLSSSGLSSDQIAYILNLDIFSIADEANFKDRNGNSLYHLFIQHVTSRVQQTEIIGDEKRNLKSLLLDLSSFFFDINSQNNDGQTIFHLLASAPSTFPFKLDIFRWINIRRSFDPNLLDVNGLTFLQVALKHGNKQIINDFFYSVKIEEIVLRLFEHPEGLMTIESIEEKSSPESILGIAMSKKWPIVVQLLIDDARFGYAEEILVNSMHFFQSAVDWKNDEILLRLFNIYKDHIKVGLNDSIVEKLLDRGLYEIYQYLKENSYPLGGADENTELHWAAKHGWLDVFKASVNDIDLESFNKKRETVLDMILDLSDEIKRDAIIDFLLQNGLIKAVASMLSEGKLTLAKLIGAGSKKLFQAGMDFSFELLEEWAKLRETLAIQFQEHFITFARNLVLVNLPSGIAFYDAKFSKIMQMYNSFLRNNEEAYLNSVRKRIDLFFEAAKVGYNELSIAKLRIHRNNILASSKQELGKLEVRLVDLSKSRVYIKFIDENGLEEDGADGGALSREFYPLVLEKLFARKDLFERMGDKDMHINIAPLLPDTELSDEMIEDYRFAGIMLGLAIRTQSPLSDRISLALLSQLLNFDESWMALKDIDPSQYGMWKKFM